ncbi:MAG: hypothetical protein ACOVN5_03355, partial [Aquidulcibacter sp.]
MAPSLKLSNHVLWWQGDGKRGKAQAPVEAGRNSMTGTGWAALAAAALMAFAMQAWGEEPKAAD